MRALVAGVDGLAFPLHDDPDDPGAPSTTLTGADAVRTLWARFGGGTLRRIWVDLGRATAGRDAATAEVVVRLVTDAEVATSGREAVRAPATRPARAPDAADRR